jgi:hypothetical protein
MELEEEERSSSSLSSSEWEDLASDEGPPDNDDREVIYRSTDFFSFEFCSSFCCFLEVL